MPISYILMLPPRQINVLTRLLETHAPDIVKHFASINAAIESFAYGYAITNSFRAATYHNKIVLDGFGVTFPAACPLAFSPGFTFLFF